MLFPLRDRYAGTKFEPRSNLVHKVGCAEKAPQATSGSGSPQPQELASRRTGNSGWIIDGVIAITLQGCAHFLRINRYIYSVMPLVVTCKITAVCRQTSTVGVSSLSSSTSILYAPAGATTSMPVRRPVKRDIGTSCACQHLFSDPESTCKSSVQVGKPLFRGFLRLCFQKAAYTNWRVEVVICFDATALQGVRAFEQNVSVGGCCGRVGDVPAWTVPSLGIGPRIGLCIGS